MARTVACTSMILCWAAWVQAAQAQPIPARPEDAEIVTVVLSNFAFAPDHLRLKAGVPVKLRFVNESGEGHDFSAPGFFAAGHYPAGSPVDGDVAVGGRQTVEVTIAPRTPGIYRVECTHFLHSIFGMHGAVEIIP